MDSLGGNVFVVAVGVVLTLLAAGVTWIVSTLVGHASRISVLEEFKGETKEALQRLEAKLDRILDSLRWRSGTPRIFPPPHDTPDE
jgi:hypothetical protein